MAALQSTHGRFTERTEVKLKMRVSGMQDKSDRQNE